jgi:hypothetical protein
LAVLAASPASAQVSRPSISSVDAAQKRTNAAICAKADADGDSYRPFVCEPRCDCLAEVLLQSPPNLCDESSPGVFDIGAVGAPSCNDGYCEGVAPSLCLPTTNPCLIPGQECVTSCSPFGCVGVCRQPCASDATCPPVPTGPAARLSGVSPPDSPNAVDCVVTPNPLEPSTATTEKINSNDALECLEQVQVTTGPCQ